MNTLENSLCASCEYLAHCCLTNDKSAIWSCSEYEVSAVHDEIFQEKILNKDTNSPATSSKQELFF